MLDGLVTLYVDFTMRLGRLCLMTQHLIRVELGANGQTAGAQGKCADDCTDCYKKENVQEFVVPR